MNNVRLVVNGVEYAGWLAVEMSAGIERQARDFKLSITREWPGATNIPRSVSPGDVCEVYIDDYKVLTGYVDATPISYDSERVTVGVNGRSKTADLVDCSANFGSGQWRSRKIESVARDLASPYGIDVLAEVSTGSVILDHQIDTGETSFESIDRLLTKRQLLSTDDAQGRLVFIDAGSGGDAFTSLEYGKNILSADSPLDYKDVFSIYTCKGQRSGNDSDFGDTVAGITASEEDKSVRRYRNLIIEQSGQVTKQDCIERVRYERLYRAAKALETTYKVAGWRQGDGKLWVPNQMVYVKDPVIGFDNRLLITEVGYRISDEGTFAMLKVAPKSGFIPSPKATKAKASKSSGGGASWSGVGEDD